MYYILNPNNDFEKLLLGRRWDEMRWDDASPAYYIAPKSSADIQSVALLHHLQSN